MYGEDDGWSTPSVRVYRGTGKTRGSLGSYAPASPDDAKND